MKKWIYATILFFLPFVVFASTNTYQRTKEELRIPEGVSVDEDNYEDILATPSVDASEKIYDFGEFLTEEEENLLYQEISSFISKHHMDLFVVTTKEDPNKETTSYLDDFFEYNFFGLGTSRDGIGFYIDLYNREVTTTTSGSAILYFDDERLDRIIDRMTPFLSAQEYHQALKEAVEMLENYMKQGIPSSNQDVTIDHHGNVVKLRSVNFGLSFLLGLLVAGISTAVAISGYKQVKKATNANAYVDQKSIRFHLPIDNFLHSHTTQVAHINTDDFGGSGGSSMGGSSTHTGGGGHTFGGRSGKF